MKKTILALLLFSSLAFGQNRIDLTRQAQGGGSLDAFLQGGSLVPNWKSISDCHGASNAVTYNSSTHAFGCNTITGGTGLSGTQYSPLFMATSSTPGYAIPPTTKGFFFVGFNLSTNAAAAPTVQQIGFSSRAVSGPSDTVLYSDHFSLVQYTDNASVAVALPTATTLENANFATDIVNLSAGATSVTVTPATWTINGASTLVIAQNEMCFIYVSPAGSAWQALCHTTSQHP